MTLHDQYKASVSEFEKQFINLNDSTEKGGYDAKPYILAFLKSHTLAMLQGEIDCLKEKYERAYIDIVQDEKNDSRGVDSDWGGQIMLRNIIEHLTEQYQIIEKE